MPVTTNPSRNHRRVLARDAPGERKYGLGHSRANATPMQSIPER